MIKARLLAFEENINTKALRERVLLMASVILLIVFCWYYLFYQSYATQRSELHARQKSINTELSSLTAIEQIFIKALKNDPNAAKRRELSRLDLQLAELDKELAEMAIGLIPARDLTRVLHDVLPASGALTISGISTQKPININLASQPEQVTQGQPNITHKEATKKEIESEAIASLRGGATSEAEETEPVHADVFKHLVELELEGNYFTLLKYLQGLEALSWNLYWQYLDYRVTDYPKAKINLGVYTLSAERGKLDG